MNQENQNKYYIDHKAKIIKKFSITKKYAEKVLLDYFSKSEVKTMLNDITIMFEQLLPHIPYIGGKKNGLTFNLLASAWALAFFRTLEKKELSTREMGKYLYEINDEYANSKSNLTKWVLTKLLGTKLIGRLLKRRAEKSQLKRYPDDWVMEFVDSEGQNFDIGFNYTECGICKFYKQMNAEQYLPYLCLMDYPNAQSLGIGLKRTQTIGNGDPMCDFRFIKNQSPISGWPPEDLPEFKGS
ncbi:MAG: hypothetical protein BAJALOKI1v1_260002 [Promethearchaeota archaeon]|nr:MAG: hypothetical protein BAJALOKI1v1_260002 [Candidatus Lokiarchaeota archaeon]